MKNKEQLAIALCIILTIAVLFWFEISENGRLKQENQELKDEIENLEDSLLLENKMNLNGLNRQFDQDCRYRNYSFYIDGKEGALDS